jgi:heme oxygenase
MMFEVRCVMASLNDETRWPPLLLALRRATRPDRARVAAYASLVRSPAGWEAYSEFLAGHRAWLDALERALTGSGAAHHPLRDGADARPGEAVEEIPAPRTRAEALGYLYVLEAFRLGCSVLARRLGGGAAEPASAGRPWGELAPQLGSVPPEEHGAVVQGALDAFAGWERCLGAYLARLGLAPVGRAA